MGVSAEAKDYRRQQQGLLDAIVTDGPNKGKTLRECITSNKVISIVLEEKK